jgi:acylphosphatase
MSETAKHIIFSGSVQGIGFRFTTLNIANRYRLTGFVRNSPNGTVEMVAQGNADDITNCLRDINDSFADYITDTTIEDTTPNPQHKTFKITF